MGNILIKNYYNALKNMYVDEVKDFKNFTFVCSNIIDDGIWNFICNVKPNNPEEYIKIFEKAKRLFENRTPRFYILKSDTTCKWIDLFKEKYNTYCYDTWFCTNINDLNMDFKSKLELKIKLCNNNTDVIETIMNGFSTCDPNDPYGDLSPTYRKALELNFGKEQDGYKTYHFVAYYDGQAISNISATIKNGVAYLNNLTTLKKYKGNGVAKELLSYIIKEFNKLNIETLVFATETGAYTETFYKKLGFTIIDYGYCFEEK